MSVLVETQVQIPIDEAEAVALPQSSWVDTLKSVLLDQGIAVAAISTPTVGAVVTSTPSPTVVSTTTPTAVLAVTSADTTAIIGLTIGGVVAVVFILICIYRWYEVGAASTDHHAMIEDRNGIFRGVAIDLK